MVDFTVVSSEDDNGTKVVEVLVTVQGAEGPSEVYRDYRFRGSERYKVDGNGKSWPKTGADFKAEIKEKLSDEFGPKASSPSP